MNERQGQPDRDPGKPHDRLLGGGAKDHGQKDEREHKLGRERCGQAEVARGVIPIAVRSKAPDLGLISFGTPSKEREQDSGRDDSTEELRDHVTRKVLPCEALPGTKADRDGGVQVAPGNVTKPVGASKDGQPEGQRHAEQADSDLRKRRGEHGTAAPPEHENEGTEELRRQPSRHEASTRRLPRRPGCSPRQKGKRPERKSTRASST